MQNMSTNLVTLHKATHRNTELYIVSVGPLDFYFSYNTVVAFSSWGTGLCVCENVWSNTTGRHLNEIDGGNKKNRLGRMEFLNKLKEVLTKHNFDVPT